MKALFICGSPNQTKMLYKISLYLGQFDCRFTPYYWDGLGKLIQRSGIVDFTVLGGRFRRRTLNFLNNHHLPIDLDGRRGPYDLVVICSDLIVPKGIRGSKLVLVQEGMTDPEKLAYHLVKQMRLPRWFAYTSATGLSDAYDIFCVASEGYRDLFINKGVQPHKIRVSGIPNFDHCISYLNNDFPYKDYVLVVTSDLRETYQYENRRKLIERAQRIANGRPLIFKFHPNEDPRRAANEVERYCPEAKHFSEGNTDHMVANCETLITRYSSVVYVAVALGKEVHSDIPLDELRRLLPIQNEGISAANIAAECLTLFGEPTALPHTHLPHAAAPCRSAMTP